MKSFTTSISIEIMNATIDAESDQHIGSHVTDNNGALHKIAMNKKTGEVDAHGCDEYPNNPHKRTRKQEEYGRQAERYAKWYVYRERGYETVPPTENPDRILATLLALVRLSPEEFQQYFGEMEVQLRSHYDGSEVDLPFEDADPEDILVYQKDIWIQPDPTTFDPPVLEQFLARFEGEDDSLLGEAVANLAVEELADLLFDIEAVSGMHVLHTNGGPGDERVHRGEMPLDRKPDTTVEIMAFDPAEVDSFHHYVVSHLAYQIRDCFLLMGVRPPVPFRAPGWGQYDAFLTQQAFPQYEDYWAASTEVDSWEPS